MTPLDFARWFEEVWGYPPFPWQQRLATEVAERGWPEVLAVPTGAGKTSALDVALFHLALTRGAGAPRRVVLVVDRRVLVDQAGTRAARLLSALEHAEAGSVSARVADGLRAVTGDPSAPLLQTAVLRGGMVRDDAWAQRPDVPLVAASTVDQVGSRLLFRGYGVSDSMRPIHAGLMGCDTLLLLDEVHLSRPFASTLEQLAQLRAPRAGMRPLVHVEMSATPNREHGQRFELADEDLAHPVLRRRLAANKPATLHLVRVSARAAETTKRQTFAKASVTRAAMMVDEGRRAVAVLLNRVDTARRAFEAARQALSDRADVELLTGRMRPLDQRARLADVLPRTQAGRPHDPEARPLVLVTTQCIEAGADLDLDGLVTECASLDALRQRCGRVDRLGLRPGAVDVLLRSDHAKSTDPIYGEALAATWRWLTQIAETRAIDFGISALDQALADHPPEAPLAAPSRQAPVILPAWVRQWCQTRPRPLADPDPALCLHGIPEPDERIEADVSVVWRREVTAALLDGGELATLVDLVAPVPPGRLEALSVPIWALPAWLALDEPDPDTDPDVDDLADVEGQATERWIHRRRRTRLALCWRGHDDSEIVDASQARPGDTLIVPTSYGGLREGTWDPAAVEPVSDLGDDVQLWQRGRPTLRLSAPWIPDKLLAGVDEDDPLPGLLAGLNDLPLSAAAVIAWLSECRLVYRVDAELRNAVLTAVRPLSVVELRAAWHGAESSGDTSTDEGDAASFAAVAVPLDDHLRGVGEWARRFVAACSPPDVVGASIVLAAELHDLGKADRQFQGWMYDGVALGPVLAKSAALPQDRSAQHDARRRAGYPDGQRHELVSLAMLEHDPELRRRVAEIGADLDLVLHLVASHHGWCRPAAPACDAPDEEVAHAALGHVWRGTTRHDRAHYGSGVVARFFRLVERFGAWELAWAEALLRLADHRRSEAEQRGEP